MEEAYKALLDEIRRRLQATKDDPNVRNTDGSNYWGPYVTRAINDREHDGPALVQYIKGVLRKTGESEGWSALLELTGWTSPSSRWCLLRTSRFAASSTTRTGR
jgi:hypothetical protein